MDIDVVGHTSGTSTAYGIDLNVSRADTNIGMQIISSGIALKLGAYADPTNDYATFTMADTGDLTIATVGNGTTDSDLTLDADGHVIFEAADGRVVKILSTETSASSVGGRLNLISNDGAALGDDHMLGRLAFQAAEDGSGTIRQGASIEAYADAAWSASENGTRLEFYTMDGNNVSEKSLTLDSDLLATFAGAVTVTGAITGDVTGNCSGTAATVTGATQAAIESIGTDGDVLTILSDRIQMNNTTASHPEIQMINQTDDASGPFITMVNQKAGGAGDDGDDLGTIRFGGYDDQGTPGFNYYASILGEIHDATSGEESGKLTLSVANHDAGMGAGLILTGGSADNEIDVTLGLGADSVVTIPGDIDLTGKMVNRVSQIVNLKGYATLQDDVYDFANAYNTDDEAPFQLDVSYGSGTIDSSTEVTQSKLFRSGGFHVPFACTVSALQTQVTCNNSGNVSIALVEYRPSDTSGDQSDYPRTVYETVVNASDNNNNKVDTVTIAAGDLDNTAVPAGSHLMIMVKGDGTSAGGTAVFSVSVGLSW